MADAVERSEMDARDREKTTKKSNKRKRSLIEEEVSGEKRETLITRCRQELEGLYKYYKEFLGPRVDLEVNDCCSIDSVIACLVEESDLSFKKLVDQIYERLKTKDGITVASVMSSVLQVGQRYPYGISSPDVNVLEDESESCLWCWEVRDIKLLPTNQRGLLNIRRSFRKKILGRVTALLAMISALSVSENHLNYKSELIKASEKLNKALNEAQIRSLVERLLQKTVADMAEKEAKIKEKELVKELERNKREVEKEKKRIDRELQKDKLQCEKELKRLQDEAEKEERRREKEEAELKKQLKRQQDEVEKDQRRREKEEAELKKQLAIQKQATIMERFLKSNKKNSNIQDKRPSTEVLASDISGKNEEIPNAKTLSMDYALSQKDGIEDTCDLLKSHLTGWHKVSHSIRCNRSQKWGIRQKPKTEPIKALKLQGSFSEAESSGKDSTPARDRRHVCADVNGSYELILDGWEEAVANNRSYHSNADITPTGIQLSNKTKKLFQFDKSCRPAYYGTLLRKRFGAQNYQHIFEGCWFEIDLSAAAGTRVSDVVGPRHPLKKDPNLEYDVESDEEWEEEDPGESLSDCEKDEEDNLEEGNLKNVDEDESEDSFLVPDGYLSENEGVQFDGMASNAEDDDDARSSPCCKQEGENEEFRALLRQQKYLHDWTERALHKNQPLIISNLMHEKATLMMAENLSGIPKLEQICLQALSMRPCHGGASVGMSTDHNTSDDDQVVHQSQSKSNTTPVVAAAIIPDSYLLEIVQAIRSNPSAVNKVVDSLQLKYPTIPKRHLKNKVREISDFVDNRWQVKREILDKLGLSISPEKGGRTKSIATFFSKRCLPPEGKIVNGIQSSPQTCRKSENLHGEHKFTENPL